MPRFLFFLYATVITLLPAVFLLPNFGAESALLFLTGDAYLYLGIAESSTTEFFSFDGEKPTNGFHPLWQGYLWLVAQATSDPLVLINISAWSAILLSLTGIWLLGVATARVTGSWLLACLMTPGVYFLVIGQGLNNMPVWGFFSGMEAGLALAISGLAVLLVTHFQENENRSALWLAFGTVLGLLMLTRLDDVFVGPAIALCWLFWTPGQFWKRIPSVILLGLPATVMLAAYLYYNLTHVGVAMPVSGMAKGGGSLLANGWVTAATFLSPLIDLRAALTDYQPGHVPIAGAAFRVVQLLVPALCSFFFIVFIRRYFRPEPWAPFVAGMCGAVVVKAGYNFVSVNYWHQATWYFSFAFAVTGFATALLVARPVAQLRVRAPGVLLLIVLLVGTVSFVQASQAYLNWYTAERRQSRIAFWNERAEIEARLQSLRPGAKLMEYGDGLLNFAFEMPVRHGFVFAGDPDSLQALQKGQLLAEAYEDGYRLLSSFEYLRWSEASTARTSDEIRAFLSQSVVSTPWGENLENFDFEIIYVYEPLSIPFIAVSKRS